MLRLSLSYERHTSGQNFSKLDLYFGENSAQKPLKRGLFMDVLSPRKNLEIYNLATTNATLMKLTMIMYLHKMFNLAEDWGVTQSA